ncbi:uncharacterized protein I303_102278 [Kwoniella dejecticola CBS 10117]|uniref:RanBD1 domain-containing protein n=1 Tax=Kwoniella dejecticola CBS 10117 TaxID=1296121 RepID=A0A1A6ABE0_9TREE|nr:uncharacterized protein I303_01582 [Kwoniella dejecticola CBS 10117]OBR87380.1 hypothetical protein I303_01582 [Kwoniella dejecticola CBS 10117]
MSTKASPSPASDKADEEILTRDNEASTKDGNASLKRVREGSLEPSQAGSSIPDPIATKKNRVGSSSRKSPGPNDIAEVEGEDRSPVQDVEVDAVTERVSKNEERPVGEVRKKVEEMSYEEEKSRPTPTNNEKNGKDEDIQADAKDGDLAAADSSWEEINKEEVEGANGDNLKRKALNRSESSFAKQEDDLSSKRSKDAEITTTEANKSVTASPAKKSQTTFSSFASSASPFASIKSPTPPADASSSLGLAAPIPAKKPQATFGSFSEKSSPFASTTASPAATSATPAPEPSSEPTVAEPAPAPVPAKKPQATFGSFSSTSSPFAASSAKATSAFGSAPVKGSAFGTYSNTSSAFSTKKTTPVEGEAKAEAGPSSFGDILKEKGDNSNTEEKVEMQEQDVTTGEEGEDTVFQTRTRLYTNEGSVGWKERGVGLLKLNVSRTDGSGARLVMRTDGVHRLILNSKLYSHLTLYPDGKMVRMTLPEDGKMTIVCFRMSNPKTVEDLCDNIDQHRPSSDKSEV